MPSAHIFTSMSSVYLLYIFGISCISLLSLSSLKEQLQRDRSMILDQYYKTRQSKQYKTLRILGQFVLHDTLTMSCLCAEDALMMWWWCTSRSNSRSSQLVRMSEVVPVCLLIVLSMAVAQYVCQFTCMALYRSFLLLLLKTVEQYLSRGAAPKQCIVYIKLIQVCRSYQTQKTCSLCLFVYACTGSNGGDIIT